MGHLSWGACPLCPRCLCRPFQPLELFALQFSNLWNLRFQVTDFGFSSLELHEVRLVRTILLIWKREMLAYFASPLAAIVAVFFLAVTGYSFWFLASLLAGGTDNANVMNEFFGSFFYWLPMLIIPPVLTMRLLAGEKQSGTIETLLTAPVSDAQVVLGKYFGALAFFIALWIPTAAYAFVLHRFSAQSAPVDFGPLLAGYFGTLLVGALYIACGVFCSAATSNPVVAATATFALTALLFFAGLLGDSMKNEIARDLFNHISSVKHLRDLARGAVDTRPVVFHLSLAVLFLFGATRILDSRNWK